jgi:Protein of unknown function (DUF3102)
MAKQLTKQTAETDAEFLREAAERIRVMMARDIIEIGRELIAVKDRVGHGNFLRWLDVEFEMSEPSAVRMMNVAREYGGKSFPVKDLKRSVLYELAAPSTPPEVRDKIERRVLAGENIALADVQALKNKAEDQAKGRAYVVDHGIPTLVEAVDRGDVPLSEARTFVRNHAPSLQQKLLAKGQAAEAVENANAAVKAKADRAATKKNQQGQQLKLGEPAPPDPTQEDSEDGDTVEQRWQLGLDQLAGDAVATRAFSSIGSVDRCLKRVRELFLEMLFMSSDQYEQLQREIEILVEQFERKAEEIRGRSS